MGTQPPVVLYRGRDYSDSSVSIGPGRYDDIAAATGMGRSAISSVRVAPFFSATLYNDRSFGGRSVTINGPADIPDLGKYADFNDKTASVTVVSTSTPEQLVACCKTAGKAGCGDYVPGSAVCGDVLAGYCTKNIGDPFCQQWCRNNTERCDAAVISWCAANPRDPYCSCINSKAGKIANPKCVDQACIRSGYLTTNMMRTACPDLIDCSIRAKLVNSGVSLATIVPIEQNCGTGAATTATSSVTSTGAAGSTTGAVLAGMAPSTSTIAIVLLMIFIMVLVVALAIYAFGDDVGASGMSV